jgi:hypothetical protein
LIQIAAIYVLPFLFVVFFAIYTKYQIIDEDDGPGWTKSETIWHRSGLAMRIVVAIMGAVWVYFPAPNPKHYFLSMAICAAAFDIGINLLRGRGILDVGKGGSDAKIGKKKWFFYLVWILTSIFLIIKL